MCLDEARFRLIQADLTLPYQGVLPANGFSNPHAPRIALGDTGDTAPRGRQRRRVWDTSGDTVMGDGMDHAAW